MNKLIVGAAALLAARCFGKNKAAKGAPKGPPPPPLLDCGTHGDVEILCGARSPEDIEATPDGKFLIVPQFVGAGRGGPATTGAVMEIFDIAKKTYSKMPVTNDPRKDWGD